MDRQERLVLQLPVEGAINTPDKGRFIAEALPVQELMDLEYTGRLEKTLADMEKGLVTKADFMKHIEEFVNSAVAEIKVQPDNFKYVPTKIGGVADDTSTAYRNSTSGDSTNRNSTNRNRDNGDASSEHSTSASTKSRENKSSRNRANSGSEHMGTRATSTNGSASKNVLGQCPICHGDVVEGEKGFGCMGYKSGCKFVMWKQDDTFKKYNKKLTKTAVKSLLKTGTATVRGFSTPSKIKFDAIISFRFDVATQTVHWKFERP